MSRLDVPENLRKQGLAHALMVQVTEEADKYGITLVLFAKPFGDDPRMTLDELKAWYERRFGFLVLQETPGVMMARMPHSTPRRLHFAANAVRKQA